MPPKETSRTPTETFLKLLIFLLEISRPISLTELSKEMGVSKQSILKYMDRLDFSYFGKLERYKLGKELFFVFSPAVRRMRKGDNNRYDKFSENLSIMNKNLESRIERRDKIGDAAIIREKRILVNINGINRKRMIKDKLRLDSSGGKDQGADWVNLSIRRKYMLGAIVGDVAGSVYEFRPIQGGWEDFPLFTPQSRFTDDTVMTLAVAEALRLEGEHATLSGTIVDKMHEYGKKWPKAGYGACFARWLVCRMREPYNSFGNGSAMRVSAAGWMANSLEEAESLAGLTAAVTHNHPEGIKGAQATAGAIYLARRGKARKDIKDYITQRYGYEMDRTIAQIRENYKYDITCQGSVPEAIIAFLESEDFEQAIRKAIWLRGDADTQAAIAGSIAEAFYGGVPDALARETLARLDESLINSYWENWNWLQQRTSTAANM